MSDSKEFLGKTLDAAISAACAYYDAPREKLEIDIIEDAKSGIFGIVGARKARIHARMAMLPDFMKAPQENSRKERRAERQEQTVCAETDAVQDETACQTAYQPVVPAHQTEQTTAEIDAPSAVVEEESPSVSA